MKTFFRRLLLAAALAGCQVASAQDSIPVAMAIPAATRSTATSVASPAPSLKSLYKQVLPSVCWIRGEKNSQGNFSMGTGWVLDAQRRLIVTNEHVVQNSEIVEVNFPTLENGKLMVEPRDYVNGRHTIRGTVIAVDGERDLAIVQLAGLPASAQSLPLAASEPENGDEVFTIAGLPEGSEGLWIMTVGHVRSSYRRSHANRAVCQVVETDLAANRGNSGGAVFNQQGEVVSVFEGFSQNARLVTMSISAAEVTDFASEIDELIAPQSAEAFHTRGQMHRQANRGNLAAADFAAALRLDSKHAPAHAAQGWCFFDRKDFRTAQTAFTKALKFDAENVSAHNGLGCVLCEQKKYDESLEALTEAIRRNPDEAQFYRNRAVTYSWMSDNEAAVSDLTRAIDLNHQNFEFFQLRGESLRQLNRPADAAKDFATALQMGQENNVGLWNQLGYALQESQQYANAVIAYGKSLELNTQQHEIHYARGNCFYSLTKYEESAQEFLAAFQLNNQNFHYVNNLGNAWYSLKRYSDSIACYNQAIVLAPQDPQLYRNRANAYSLLGNKAAATADLQKAQTVEASQKG